MATTVTRGFGSEFLRLVLKPLGRTWMRFAKSLARVNTMVLMAASFFLLVFPISLLRKAGKSSTKSPVWVKREALPPDHFRKQY